MKGLIVKEKTITYNSDLKKPEPGKGEVLIKVHSASANPYDMESAAGIYDNYFKEYGFDQAVQTGLEFSGIIKTQGNKFNIGERVYGYAHLITGCKTHAEYITLPEEYISAIPTGLSFEEAAALPIGILTSLSIYEDLAPKPSDLNVLIIGASGGVGVYATQLAKQRNHQITALVGKGHVEFLKELGAHKAYEYVEKSLNDLEGNYDLILDFSTRFTLDDCRSLLSASGKFIPALPDDQNGGTSEDQHVAYLMVMHGDTNRLESVETLLTSKSLVPVIEEVYNFNNYNEAFRHLQKSGKRGRIILNW
ncbi:NADP-dependent oxidoreductase [uncultured Kiloniella sp.]|uniref:NADP-dependent oxidoreductase n=1 Tax=uncultured Kiloniella sp. TaxID=1133091 RepID=UPI00260F9734|nr:NADP-dependent oxidoreductase [uncultured Kiloniella sp.]